MKRLMTMFLILALVKVADAGYVDLVISSLNGQPITPQKEITIFPSQTIGISVVYIPEAQGWSIFSISKEIVISPQGSITANLGVPVSTPLNPGLITWKPGWWGDFSRITIIDDPSQGQVGDPLIDTVPNDIGSVAPGIVFDNFLFHCNGPFDVIVKLVENPNTLGGASLEVDQSIDAYLLGEGPGIIIHVPEPMTITTLGLGVPILSGFLRRKR